jgi:pilus assembly protein FimV
VEETGTAASADDAEGDSDEAADDRTDKESAELDIGDDGELDESFLDELDAELDKVAGEDDATGDEAESDLDDLELDVSDEDLALMEEFSETDVDGPADAPEKAEDDELSLDDELGLEDTLSGEEPADPEQELEGAEQLDENLADSHSDDVAPPVASDPTSSRDSGRDIDESDLGDDDDFDFLSGTDEAATKLDLARAYVEMGDVDGARDILEEVALEGNEEQKAEAQDLLKNLS